VKATTRHGAFAVSPQLSAVITSAGKEIRRAGATTHNMPLDVLMQHAMTQTDPKLHSKLARQREKCDKAEQDKIARLIGTAGGGAPATVGAVVAKQSVSSAKIATIVVPAKGPTLFPS